MWKVNRASKFIVKPRVVANSNIQSNKGKALGKTRIKSILKINTVMVDKVLMDKV